MIWAEFSRNKYEFAGPAPFLTLGKRRARWFRPHMHCSAKLDLLQTQIIGLVERSKVAKLT